MINLPGYKVHSEVHTGRSSTVYRGVRVSDQLPVVLKVLRNPYPTASELERYRREHQVSTQHQLVFAVPILALERLEHRLALIYPDDGSVSLKRQFAGQPLEPVNWLQISLQICDALEELHNFGWVHCDINPSNILIQRESGKVKLTDLELCGVPERGELVLGTLAYMAPEQTGRTHLDVDARSDLYALGATLFELATARQVFPDLDEASLLHAQLATVPPMIDQLNQNFPAALALIVAKLLAKAPADRYQSARGLRFDLEEARQRLALGRLDPFKLGSRDRVLGLRATAELFGRDAALATLRQSFENAANGSRAWVHIEGPAGSGKTALFERFAQSLASDQTPASGRGDQLSTAVPYASVARALQGLMNCWLALPDDTLEDLKIALKQALGINATVIAALVPDLRKLLGPLPPLLPLGASAEQARFQLAMHAFVRTAIAEQQPLILHLDDLHWADPASLDFLKRLLSADFKHLLLVTVARSEHASSLREWLAQLDSVGVQPEKIVLGDLVAEEISLLVKASVGQLAGGAHSEAVLVSAILRKTLGNPFFVRQFMLSLVDSNVLTPGQTGWELDVQALSHQNLTDNVLQFLDRKLNQLPASWQAILLQCACIGSRVDLTTLRRLSELETDMAEQSSALAQLLREGVLVQLSEVELAFVHERIREACLASAKTRDRLLIHRSIGEIWRIDWQAQADSRSIFDVVNQLNLAATLLHSEAEQGELAELNIQAAELARSQTAYEASLQYAGHAVSLLPFSIYQEQPLVALKTHVLLAEAQASAGQLQAAVQVFQHALALAPNEDAKAHVLDRLASALQSSGDAAGALTEVQNAMALLGESLSFEGPGHPQESAELMQNLAQDDVIDRLQHLPLASGRAAQIGALFDKAVIGVYFSRPEALGYVTARSVSHVLQTGLTPEAGVSIGWWSMVLCMQGQHALASRYAVIAEQSQKRFQNDYYGGAALMLAHAMSLCWTIPYQENYEGAERAYQLCHQSGNLQFASYALIVKHISAVAEGADFVKMLETAERWRDYCDRYVPLELGQAKIRCFALRQLMGQQPEPLDCEAIVLAYEAQKNGTDVCESLTEMARLELLFGRYEAALALAERAAPMFAAGAAGSLLLNYLHHVILAVASARVASHSETRRAELLLQYASSAQVVEQLSSLSTRNFSAYQAWVSAEGLIVNGESDAAVSALLQGIAHAQKFGYHLIQGKMTAVVAECFRAQGRSFAGAMEQDAQQLYARANAFGLTRQMPQRGSATVAERRFASSDFSTGTPTTGGSQVDLVTVLKANEAIVAELDFDQLVLRLLRIAVENAGAQRGVLALRSRDRLMIEADSVDGRVSERVGRSLRCPDSLLNYVARTQLSVVWDDGVQGSQFRDDPYFQRNIVRAALCLPLLRKGELTGVIYLENNLVPGVFSRHRLEMLNMLLGQATIAIENAALYQEQRQYAQNLEQRVRERTLELENANRALARLAEIDGLTQISNRRSFDEYAHRLLAQSKPIALILGDVDDFKRYNDRYGHAAGDEVLRRVGASLRSLDVPDGALVARYGGEEFAILLTVADLNLALEVGHRWLSNVLALAIEHADSRAKPLVSLSVGVALSAPVQSDSPELSKQLLTLIEQADAALYRAKHAGRARVMQ